MNRHAKKLIPCNNTPFPPSLAGIKDVSTYKTRVLNQGVYMRLETT